MAHEGPLGRARVDAERAATAQSAAMAANLNLDMRVSPRDKTASWPAALAQRHTTERELYQERGI